MKPPGSTLPRSFVVVLALALTVVMASAGCQRAESTAPSGADELRRLLEGLPQVVTADVYLGGIGAASPYIRLFVAPDVSVPAMRSLPRDVASTISGFDSSRAAPPATTDGVDVALTGARGALSASTFSFSRSSADLEPAAKASATWMLALTQRPPGDVSFTVSDTEGTKVSLTYTGMLTDALTWVQGSALAGLPALMVATTDEARPRLRLISEGPLAPATAARWIGYEKAINRPLRGMEVASAMVVEKMHGRQVELNVRFQGASAQPAEATSGPLVWPLVDVFRTEPPPADPDGLASFELRLGHAVAPAINNFTDLLGVGVVSPELPDWTLAYNEHHTAFIAR